MKKIFLLFAGLAFLTFKNQAQTVIDYDGNEYDTVVIGTQTWLKQNLKVTHYNNGVPIPNVTDNTIWANLTTGARCYYNNDSSAYDSVYGALYNWYAVNDPNHICPEGWHVSTNDEWQTTETYLGSASIAGGKMKEAGTLHWNSPNTGATNSSGFTGLPGGARDPINNDFRFINENGCWWTASAYPASMAWSTYMWYLNAGVDHNPASKKYGFNIRCVRDIETGIGDINSIEKIKIYPNPAINKISIEYADIQDLKMQIFNVVGECVMQGKLNNLSKPIDISSLSKGIYVIQISCVDWIMKEKIIKE
jgi:uncharacterized protein (TIGR02145 family)